MKRALTLAILTGCHDPTPVSGPPADPVTFVADGTTSGTGPALSLRGHADGPNVVVDVVATGIGELHGVAFRLDFDPAVLSFSNAQSSGAWSRQAIHLASEGSPGEVAVVWTEKGTTPPLHASAETPLGSLTFAPRQVTPTTTSLAFRTDRSKAIDVAGTSLALSWRGGVLTVRRTGS
jgi:hypothetical protein